MKIIDTCKTAIRPLSLAVAFSFCVAPAAQATVLSDFLTFDGGLHLNPPVATQGGGEDKLQDDSLSRLVKSSGAIAGQNPTLEAGDILFGLVTLSDVLASTRPNASVPEGQITILYSATVTSKVGDRITLGATAAGLYDVATLCGALCGTAGILPTTIGVVLSTTSPSPTNDPLTWSASNFTTNFNTGANAWSWEATFGLSADPGNTAYFEAVDGGAAGSTERGAFDITSQAFAANWLPVDVNTFPGSGGWVTNDVTLDFGIVTFAGDEEFDRGWHFRDQTTFYVNPEEVPEPGSLALLGIALAGLAGVSRIRRKQ